MQLSLDPAAHYSVALLRLAHSLTARLQACLLTGPGTLRRRYIRVGVRPLYYTMLYPRLLSGPTLSTQSQQQRRLQ